MPVPLATTFTIIVRMSVAVFSEIGWPYGSGSNSRMMRPCGSRICVTNRGVIITPRFAMADATSAICNGLARSLSCPIAEMRDERVVPLEVARGREPSGRERDRRTGSSAPGTRSPRADRSGRSRTRAPAPRARPAPSCSPTSPKITLHEFVNAVSERGGRAARAGLAAEVLDRGVGERQVELVRVRPHAVQAVAVLERGRRRDHLERRPRREQLVVRAGEQRRARVGVQSFPRGADLLEVLRRQLVRIERRVRDHRQDVAVARIHRHDRPGLGAERARPPRVAGAR